MLWSLPGEVVDLMKNVRFITHYKVFIFSENYWIASVTAEIHWKADIAIFILLQCVINKYLTVY